MGGRCLYGPFGSWRYFPSFFWPKASATGLTESVVPGGRPGTSGLQTPVD